uniref:Small ribosomal subunit protein uS7c n=1 Tax=Codium simulans TaxID=589376 RepID=A0A1I9LKG7_9CHLO|nr:30S ribosomal protein S7 [Codium simulans]ANJ70828.1 30S ribosomal protein S7 [Codium simulans]
MARHKIKKNKLVLSDPIYNSNLIQLITNHILKKGKKNMAYTIVNQTLNFIEQKQNEDAIEILDKAINNLRPAVEIKTKRIGGAVYKIPIEIQYYRSVTLAIQLLLKATQDKIGKTFYLKLATEIIDASQNTGIAIRKKEEIHRIAEANVKIKAKTF